MQLRTYQVALIERARTALREHWRILITSPTGSGKTCLTAHMLVNASGRGKRCWFVVHRRELVKQSVLTLSDSAGLHVGIIAAGWPADDRPLVQVASVQSLARRYDSIAPPDLIVLDEAHHSPSETWANLLRRYPQARVIGLTATPQRLDGNGLGQWFSALVEGPTTADLIEQGWLSPYKLFAPSNVDLKGIHTVAGDYNRKELDARMMASRVTGSALDHYRKRAMGKRALIFMWSVASSRDIVAEFQAAGIPAAHVDGETDERERDAAMAAFRDGRIWVLSNCELFSEGVDVPTIEALFMLRPTQSLGLYLQQVGRALRPSEGKVALIFDHAGNVARHGLPDDLREWSLEGGKGKANAEVSIRICPKCYAVIRPAPKCTECGWVFKVKAKVRAMETVEGELAEVDVDTLRAERDKERKSAKTVEELAEIGRRRGYRNPAAWAHHVWAGRNKWRTR